MKLLKRLFKWSILALCIELAGFIYVDKFYFAGITSFNFQNVDLKKSEIKAKINVKIPADAKNLCASFDGKFAAYILDGEVNVLNRETGIETKVKLYKGTQANYIYWLFDRDRMYVGQKGSNFIKFSNYDALKDENIQWNDENGKDVRISIASSQYDVKDVANSTNTNTTYVNIGSSSKSIIYRFDTMSRLTKQKELSSKIGKIGIMQLEDRFIYEDLSKKTLNIEGYANLFKDRTISSPCFIGADFDDMAYIGSRTGEKVNKIYYGLLKNSIRNWKSIELPISVTKENITITKDGDIYLNDGLDGNIIDLKTNKSYSYTGKLIRVYNNGMVSLDGDTLKENKLE